MILVSLVMCSIAVAAPGRGASASKGEGTEGRRWVAGARAPDRISSPQYGVRVQPVLIPMRDGEELRAVLYLPVGAEVGPCIGVLDGYAPPSLVAGTASGGVFSTVLSNFASRGYAGAYVHLRTTSAPPEDALYYRYAEDGYDVIEWMAEQPWCNGRVGLAGGSLLGISEWLAAKARPPHLKAMVPDVACGDCYWDLWFRGGMLPGEGRRGRRPPVTGTDEYAAASRHRNYDGWWRTRVTTAPDRARIARTGLKILNIGGWDDYMLGSYSKNYTEYRAAGGDAKLILGPWAHGDSALGGEAVEPYDYMTYQVMFFDRWLKGIRNGIDTEPRVLIYVEGPNQWRYEREWPIPDTKHVRYHLRASRSRTVSSINDGSLTFAKPTRRERSVGYSYSPDGPFNNAGGGDARLTEDQRPDEQRSLTWTTPPVSTPTELTGRSNVEFWAKVAGRDTDFVVELSDVAPDGTSRQLARGWLNAQRFFSRTNPKPLPGGAVHKFEIPLWPTAYVLDAGHRLRVSLAGSDSPGSDPNPLPSRVTILQDAAHPSSIVLPLIGNSALVRAYRRATR